MRHRLKVLVIVVAMVFLLGGLCPEQAEAQIPVTDVLHIIESIAQLIQQFIDEAIQYEQLYHAIQNYIDLAERVWRDPGVLVGEFIYGSSLRLGGYSSDFRPPDEENILPAYVQDNITDRMSALYPTSDPRGYYIDEFGQRDIPSPYEFKDALDMEEKRLEGEGELNARSMGILKAHLNQLVEGVIGLKKIREKVESAKGAEKQGELTMHFLSFMAEEQLAMRQLEMMKMNLEALAQGREASERGVALSLWKDLLQGEPDLSEATDGGWDATP